MLHDAKYYLIARTYEHKQLFFFFSFLVCVCVCVCVCAVCVCVSGGGGGVGFGGLDNGAFRDISHYAILPTSTMANNECNMCIAWSWIEH